MTTIPLDRIESILKKGKELEDELGKENTSDRFVELSKEYAEIQSLYSALRILQNTLAKYITSMIHGEDQYLAAKEASSILFKKGNDAVVALKSLSKDVFLEIRAGTGGDEAALFCRRPI